MLGAIIGDLAGSIYEFEQTKKITPIKMKKIIEKESFFSDDTILTIAIADAILTKSDYCVKLKEWAKKYKDYLPNVTPYFPTIFSPGFTDWVNGNKKGTSGGNGAMMRISPIGFLFDNEKDVIENVKLATIPSHNSEQAIYSATIVALIIFYAKQGFSKEEIFNKLNLKVKRVSLKQFNYTCEETLELCLYSFYNATSFEDGIRIALSFGGDTDTNACIVGSLCEAFYGVEKKLKDEALSKLPDEMKKIILESEKYCIKR